MEQYEVAKLALTQRAEAERLYTNYALMLASTFALLGVALIIAGLGDHLDILVQGSEMEARFVNASPGVVLWLLSSVLFWMAKPKRLRANVLHTTEAQAAEQFYKFVEATEARVRAEQKRLEERVDELLDIIDAEDDYTTLEYRMRRAHRKPAPQAETPRPSQASSGSVSFELYQGGVKPDQKDEKD